MYISGVQSGKKLRKRRFYSPYLGEVQGSTSIDSGIDTARAVLRNRDYAQRLGWGTQFNRIAQLVGFRDRSPDEASFVRAVANWQASQPGLSVDGIIGPQAWRRLQAVFTNTSINAVGRYHQLPIPGVGYYSYSERSRQYGRAQTIQALQAISQTWATNHPNGPRIGIGDISFADGSHMPPHRSHRNGLDVDMRPIRNDGREDRVTIQSPEYSRRLTQELVNVIRANGILPVRVILFNDPSVRGVRSWAGHDNHLHISFQLQAASRRR